MAQENRWNQRRGMCMVGRRGSDEIFECVAAGGAGNSAPCAGIDFYLPRVSEAGAGRCGDARVFHAARISRLFCGAGGDSGMYWRGAAVDLAVYNPGTDVNRGGGWGVELGG